MVEALPAYNWWQIATVLMGGVATLAIFSFLIRENPFFRFFEHLYIGIASGWGIFLTIKNYLWPKLFMPLLGLDLVRYPDGTLAEPYNPLSLLLLLPLGLGLLYYFVYSRKYSWLAKLVIGLSLGASAGLAFEGFFNQMLPQFQASFKPLLVFSAAGLNWERSFRNMVFVFALLSIMYYFFLSFRRKGAFPEKVAGSGRWLLMICFGAFFGSTVMARMALLVERIQFLLSDWLEALGSLLH
jgi:hypothetical protein